MPLEVNTAALVFNDGRVSVVFA